MNTAQEIITNITNAVKALGYENNETLKAVKNTLQSADALRELGYTNDDQEAIEEAHKIISSQIKYN